MRTLAIGDIHGCLTALDTLLAAVKPRPEDVLVALGDFTDRGPDSKGVIERLIALQSECNLVPIMGNHDEMMLVALTGRESPMWLWCGGKETLQSYGHQPHDELLECVPEAHREFLIRLRPYHEDEKHIFAHATVDPNLPMDQQKEDALRWIKLDEPIAHASGKTLVCGHTKQRSGMPLVMPRTVCIDTGAYDPNGWLTCLDVGSGTFWQANQKGKTRGGHLDMLR